LTEPACPFCSATDVLWESEHYRILPDAFPRCSGHVLLITRDHYASHMHAPAEWLPELRAAQERVRSFLLRLYGAAAFYENGGARQQVPHAHLHGFPFRPHVKRRWLEEGKAERISGWEEARREKERSGHYFYLETGDGCFLIRRYGFMLRRIKAQLVRHTDAALDPDTGKMLRGGPAQAARTVRAWADAWLDR
jgi:diadenosine tetraphosphate (Ap4A) HIT family hydrolase